MKRMSWLLASCWLVGCSDDGGMAVDAASVDAAAADTAIPATIEVTGRWANSYGFTEEISAELWGTAMLVKYDNDENFGITQNPPDDQYFPNKFNKHVWTELEGDQFYYCIIDFGKDSAAEAENTPNMADATEPESGGCGGFPWTRLAAAVEVHGSWTSNFGGTEDITSFDWSGSDITKYDNGLNFAITQSPADAEYFPGKFNKLVWTEPDGNGFFYCTVDFGKDTAEQAENTPNVADDTDPASGGCSGFPWTQLALPQ